MDEQLARKRTKMNRKIPRFIHLSSFWVRNWLDAALGASALILCSNGQLSRLPISHREAKAALSENKEFFNIN
jgi:hypothetical protein